jgi:Carboxypeptidase regulatory-like domain
MRFTTFSRLLGTLAVIALLVPGLIWAQSTTQGAIAGTVMDASGAVLPNITVNIKNLDKGFTASAATNSSGGFGFPLLSPGTYVVTVAGAGFKQFSEKTTVQVGETTTVNPKLEVGAAGTTVEVSGEAPLINVETADNSNAFDQNLVANIPNGGNDLTAVAYTSPGVVMNSAGGYGNFNVNGLPATSNMFVVDGENQMDPFLNLNNSGPTNLMLGKNSIQEATVVTDSVSGQYGQQAGAQVNYVSKGGTNQYHGNVEYQWTGRYLDANDWFNGGINGSTTPAPFANNNIWMASFGGPIKKDKLFFFVDTEGIRYIVPSTTTVQIPTADFLNDTIANLQSGGPVANGYNAASANTIATYQAAAKIWGATPGSGNSIGLGPSSCVDPLYGVTVDTPASGSCFQNFTGSPALPAKETLLIGRFDWNITNRDRVFFRGDLDTGTQATYADPIDPAAFSAASYQPEYNNTLNWTHAFSGTATNQFIAALSYYRAIFTEKTNGTTSPFPFSLYLSSPSAVTVSPVGLGSATGLNALNFVFPQGRNVTQYQFVDDFAKVIGRHALKFGVNFRRYDISNFDQSELITPLVFASMTDFFNGSASFYLQNNVEHNGVEPMNTGGIGIYAQDEWSITPRFKLTLALRGEHNFNPTCDINCFTMPVAPFGTIANQGVNTPYDQALNTGRKDAFNSVQAVNLSPRVGFTWSPRDDSKTVIGGAFSILYDAFPAFITDSFVNVPYLIGVQQENVTFGGTPSTVSWGDPTGGAGAVTAATANTIRNGNSALGIPSLSNGLTAAGLLAAGGGLPSITGFPSELKTPQVQEWNLSVQQALDSKSKLMLQYTGNHGIHEAYPDGLLNAASADPTTGLPLIAGLPATSPDGRFGSYTEWYSGAVSNYNGLTASYSRRMTAGLVLNAAYTWAHSLDEISNGGLLNYGQDAIQTQINPLSLRANNYGNADYDVRHSFNANYVWTEPFHMENRVLSALLGGWMLSENFTTRSGVPFTVTDGTATIGNASSASVLPAEVLGPAQQSCRNGYSACFNSAQFTSNSGVGLPFPTQMRNQYRGPNFFDSDVTVGKSFHATERLKMTIGMNVYNIFNRPNFQNPNRVWSGSGCDAIPAGGNQPGCGFITGQAAPPTGPYGSFFQGLPAGREGQLQAKIEF